MPRRRPKPLLETSAPTHWSGQHSRSSLYEQVIRADRQTARSGVTLSPSQIAALCILPLAIIPWASEKAVTALIREPLISGQFRAGLVLSLLMVAVAAWQLAARSQWAPDFRKWLLILFAAGVPASSVMGAVDTWRSWSQAPVGKPQRAFEMYERCGKRCDRLIYQSGDGRIIGTDEVRPLPGYAPTCVTVREVIGSGGLRWARVVDRSRQPDRRQLAWPIRSEDCFSDLPLGELPR